MVAHEYNYLWNKTQETISGGSEQKQHFSFDSFWNFHHKYYFFKPVIIQERDDGSWDCAHSAEDGE